jgi:oxygen-independent coproporphyrinogen-3 oxidase
VQHDSLPRHVYVHVPFCARRCVYCDFAIAVRRTVPVADYVQAIGRELALRFPTGERWPVETLYFGGGTPSRLGGEGMAKLIGLFAEHVQLEPGAEVTIEANPEDVTVDAVRRWREAGVNRLSLGAQSFDDAVLRWMHRTHDAAAIRAAVERVRTGGIEDLSLDLIFALPNEVQRSWAGDVAAALALQPTHISLYGLTTEPQTALGRWRDRRAVTEVAEERYEEEFLYADEAVRAAGFEHYEVSNFALPGRRAGHNSSYWRAEPYAGVGPGAHEFDGSVRRWNTDAYVEWERRLAAGTDPLAGCETLDEANRAAEMVYLGLRTSDGLRLTGAELVRSQPWVDAGWGTVAADGRLVLTALGWLRLDSLAADLTLIRSRS